ncbi:hypothetical protein ACIQXF_19405 [Lysinibacillus sp. NPDC097231]|uniref:hypothetical protein n=1 Tax=Lysinibacillus sp. NPDC097231 TaxID=3364142 RepID=UPI0038265C9E
MVKKTNKQVEILDTQIILEKYKENIELMQKSLKQCELDISKLQSEGLMELEKLAIELSMLQKLSTSIEMKANGLICDDSKANETSIPSLNIKYNNKSNKL